MKRDFFSNLKEFNDLEQKDDDTLEFISKDIPLYCNIDTKGQFYKTNFIYIEKESSPPILPLLDSSADTNIKSKTDNLKRIKSNSLKKIKTTLSEKQDTILSEEDPKSLVKYHRKYIHSLPKIRIKYTTKYVKSYNLEIVKEESSKYEQSFKLDSLKNTINKNPKLKK